MMSVLLLFLPFLQTLLLEALIHWFNDNWKLLIFKRGLRSGLILAFVIPRALSSFLGTSLFLKAPSDLLSRILSLFLIILRSPPLPEAFL
jgi:uncharacterized membrane protein YfcA